MTPGLEWKCLWAIADDYEEVPEIKLDLKKNESTDVTAEDVSAALMILVNAELARAYRFHRPTQEYTD